MTAPELPELPPELEDLLRCFALARMPLSELKDAYIRAVLETQHGNASAAARILQMNRRTLYRRGFTASPYADRPRRPRA